MRRVIAALSEMGVSCYAKQPAIDTIARLAGQGLDLVSFWQASTEALASTVTHYVAPR